MNFSHDIDVFKNIFGPLTNQEILSLHPDKEHIREIQKALREKEMESKYED